MNTCIEIRDLVFTYPGASVPTLNGINLTVEKGDFLAVIGGNGCGKSTLCKALNGLIPHFIAGDYQGKVLIEGEDVQNSDIGSLAQKVGYVYQDFENQIVRPTVLDDASYACLNYGMRDYLERGKEALVQCGLVNQENEYIWQLSGGQTHLLALAGALALGPDILILDEPIAQLDPGHADRIYEILKELNEVYGKTIIVIEHHTEYIADYCKNVVLLKNGKTFWKLPAKDAMAKVDELLKNSIFPPQITQAAHQYFNREQKLPTTLEEGKKYFAQLDFQADIQKERSIKHLLDKGKGEAAVSFHHVSLSYRSVKGEPRQIFDRISVQLCKGERIALIGSNGAGKSTLMKLMIGLLKPTEGEITVLGESIQKKKPETLAKQISLVYQNPEDMFIKDSIYADISYAMKIRNIPDWEEKTNALLERFRLMEFAQQDGRLLSGGQMRRASLAIGIALNPKILLLDEPTANLDIATRKEIIRTLNEMREITETVMIATHDMQLVSEWADRIIVLNQGYIAADGIRDEIFGNKELAHLVGIRPPEIFQMGQALSPEAYCYTIDEFSSTFKERS